MEKPKVRIPTPPPGKPHKDKKKYDRKDKKNVFQPVEVIDKCEG